MALVETVSVPSWRRNPATVNPPKGIDDFIKRANDYFAEVADFDVRPTITGLALAVGLPGPTSLIRLGQRIPELRYAISRCMMTISTSYEEMIGSGNASGPIFMLKNIPDFDPDEPVGAPPVQFFNERKEVLLTANVTGAARSDEAFDDEDPLETYVRLVRQRGYIPGEKDITDVESNNQPAVKKALPRKVLTIITEGWEDE